MTELAKSGKIEMTLDEVNSLFGYSQIILSVNITIVNALIAKLRAWNHESSTVSDVLCSLVSTRVKC